MTFYEIWIYKDRIVWNRNDAVQSGDISSEGLFYKSNVSDVLKLLPENGDGVQIVFVSSKPSLTLKYQYISKIYDMINNVTYETFTNDQEVYDIFKNLSLTQ